jgi:hypothetical protein
MLLPGKRDCCWNATAPQTLFEADGTVIHGPAVEPLGAIELEKT